MHYLTVKLLTSASKVRNLQQFGSFIWRSRLKTAVEKEP